MRFVDFIALMDREVTPEQSKVHLATSNGCEDPLDVYLAGKFEDWQSSQSKRNFERRFVVAFISLPGTSQWLYAGVYTSEGCEWDAAGECYNYRLTERMSCSEFKGRLVIDFQRTARQPYPDMENLVDRLTLCEIKRERMSVGSFPGFKEVKSDEKPPRHSRQEWTGILAHCPVQCCRCLSDFGHQVGETLRWQRVR
jgi:hypothetical protein